jgi:large subunit ribosomal protein L24
MKIRLGDTVLVIAGKEKGKSGRVMRVILSKNRVVVEGLNMRTKHIKRTPQQAGQRVKFEGALSVSNVMLVDPKTKKPTRVGYTVDAKTGRKDRIAKASKEIIKGAATTAPSKKSASGAPEKKAFWERGSKGPASEGTTETKGKHDKDAHPAIALPRASRSENG